MKDKKAIVFGIMLAAVIVLFILILIFTIEKMNQSKNELDYVNGQLSMIREQRDVQQAIENEEILTMYDLGRYIHMDDENILALIEKGK